MSQNDPVTVILDAMRAKGVRPSELVPRVGPRTKVLRILTRKRPLDPISAIRFGIVLDIPDLRAP